MDELTKRILFISYDGLTDPLGGSQILPYLFGIQETGRKVSILSFEKSERYALEGRALETTLEERGIDWTPLRFTVWPRYLAKAWDLLRMMAYAAWLCWKQKIEVVHCRSYQAAQAASAVKRLLGTRMLFDMRGLWVDERVDGGLWNLSSKIDSFLYMRYKRIEAQLLRDADHIIVLTTKALPIITNWSGKAQLAVTTIPCCADYDFFKPPTSSESLQARVRLGIGHRDIVLTYLGSLGTWYQFNEMMEFFARLKRKRPDAKFLIITKDWGAKHEELIASLGMSELREGLRIIPAARHEIPVLLSAADVMVSFIKPSFSKLASSPTKIAEVLAMGIPVICNSGIGDTEEQIRATNAGFILKDLSEESYEEAVACLDDILSLKGENLRERSRKIFGLEIAKALYASAYDTLDGLDRI